jgi:opacity protein-like surface antigen
MQVNHLSISLVCLLFFGRLFAANENTIKLSNDSLSSSRSQNDTEKILPGLSQGQKYYGSIYFQFNVSALFADLTKWKNSLHQNNGSHPSSNFMVFGGECGWVINKYLQIGAGYEFLFTSKVTTIEVSGDQINSTYLYGSLKIGMPLRSIPELLLFGSIDVGSLSATEVMERYIIQNFERSGTTTAYRFMIGAQYYSSENWSITVGTGYLSGNIDKITAYGATFPDFSLDLSGIIIRGMVNYHIPL